MTTQATITLESLHCILESDLGGTSHSEPYIWPALAIVTDSFEVIPQFANLSDSQNVIKNEMRAGETATISYPVNSLTANFEDSQTTTRQLILIVALWEKDDTPLVAVQAGYQAFLGELHAAIGANLLSLNQADEAGQKVIIDDIKTRVYNKVYSAIDGKLSAWEKTKVGLGWLNLDDFMGSDFQRFPDVVSTTFTLSFKGYAGDLIIENTSGTVPPTATNPPVEYEIQGNLKVQPVTVNLCQAEIDAVNAAQSALQGLETMVQSLQSQLQHATPQ